MDAQTSNEFSIAYLKRSIAAQEERIIAGLMKGVDTVEMEDRLQGGLAVLHRIQRESSSNRQADGLACNILTTAIVRSMGCICRRPLRFRAARK